MAKNEVQGPQETSLAGDGVLEAAAMLGQQDVAEQAVEAAPVVEQAPEVKEEPVSRGWAAIKAQERKLRQEREELKKLKAELEAARPVEDFRKKVKENPLEALKEAGWEFQDLADRVLNDGAPGTREVEKKAMSEVEQLRAEMQKMREELRQKEYAEHDKRYMSEISETLKDPQFKYIAANPKANQMLFDLAVQHASSTGEILPPKELASILQETFVEEMKALAKQEALRELLDVKSISGPAKSAPVRTISSGMTATPQPQGEVEELNEYGELLRAAKLLEG